MKKATPARQVIGLGRGIKEVADGDTVRYVGAKTTRTRVEAIARHYHNNRQIFTGSIEPAHIVFSGSHSGVANGQEKPRDGSSEASWSADYAMSLGIPHELITVEPDSISTFDNFIRIVRLGVFEGMKFSKDNPLGIGVSWAHNLRAQPISEATFDMADFNGTQLIGSGDEHSPLVIARESFGAYVTRRCITEAHVVPGDLSALEEASNLFNDYAKNPTHLFGGVATTASQS